MKPMPLAKSAISLSPAVVTGAAGFIGRHLCRELASQGVEVIGIDALIAEAPAADQWASFRQLEACGVQMVRARLEELDLPVVLARARSVFHLAARTGVRESFGGSFASYASNNIVATQLLIEACRTHASNLAIFVYASSSSVYGESDSGLVSEDSILFPASPYAVSKLAGEQLVLAAARRGDVPGCSLRYFTVYGPQQRPDMGFSKFIAAVEQGKPVTVFGDGSQERDFTAVDDVVRATILAALHAQGGDVFNICGGSPARLRDVISLLGRLMGRSPQVRYVAEARGDVSRTAGNPQRAMSRLGWNPSVSLEAGLHAQIRAWREGTVESSESV